MSGLGESCERSERVANARPPLRGGGSRTREPRGVIEPPTEAARDCKKKEPWYVCKRCGKYVLGYKKTRGFHNKRCKPYEDPVGIHDSALDKLVSELAIIRARADQQRRVEAVDLWTKDVV